MSFFSTIPSGMHIDFVVVVVAVDVRVMLPVVVFGCSLFSMCKSHEQRIQHVKPQQCMSKCQCQCLCVERVRFCLI